jgi:hypothetical protein
MSSLVVPLSPLLALLPSINPGGTTRRIRGVKKSLTMPPERPGGPRDPNGTCNLAVPPVWDLPDSWMGGSITAPLTVALRVGKCEQPHEMPQLSAIIAVDKLRDVSTNMDNHKCPAWKKKTPLRL